MTTPRAIVLLVLSVAIFVGGIATIAASGISGLVSSDARSLNSGARTGSNPVTPGPSGPTLEPELRDEMTRIARTLAAYPTAVARTPTPPPITPFSGTPTSTRAGTSAFTVLQLVDPEPPGFFVTNPGMRRVAIEVRQDAIGEGVRYSFGLFRIRDDSGDEYGCATTNSQPGFDTGELDPVQSRTG